MTDPKKTCAKEWGLPEASVQDAWDQVVASGRGHSPQVAMMYVFCQIRGINEARFRTLWSEAMELLHCKPPSTTDLPYTDWWLTSAHPIAIQAQRTLTELLQPSRSLNEIPHDISFASFVSHHPEWHERHANVFVFFRDHPSVKNKPGVLIQRTQLSGNCYIQGAVVHRHYLVCRTNSDILPQPAIDIRKFILVNLRADLLSRLFTHVGGGSSHEIAQLLLSPNPSLFSASSVADITKMLRRWGPGLVTNFSIENSFLRDSTRVTYRGAFTSEIQGRHSMVCIGSREAEDGAVLLLLQNWWPQKQFVEIDQAYLEQSGASIWFSRKEHIPVSPAFPCTMTMAEYAEAGYIDGDDLAPEET